MLAISRVLVGLLLLVLGRRLYWLFVAGIGFVCGLQLAPRLLPEQSELVVVIVALGLALVGALLALVATKVLLGVIGFLAGGAIAVLLLPNLVVDADLVVVGLYVVAGLIGAVLLIVLFDWALIVLSSLAGSGLIVAGVEQLLEIPRLAGTVLVIALAAVGTLIQIRFWRPRRPSR